MPFTGLNTNNDLGQNYGVINNSLRSLAKSQDGGAFNPSGVMTMYGGNTAPRGWLLCDGSAVSRTQFANLFGVIGTNFGSGDGSTTFNLPDMRGRVAVGQDTGNLRVNTWNVLGQSSGEQNHTLTQPEMPSHRHAVGYSSGGYIPQYSAPGGVIINQTGHPVDQNGTLSDRPADYGTGYSSLIQYEGGSGSHNNMQPYQVFNYIIKV